MLNDPNASKPPLHVAPAPLPEPPHDHDSTYFDRFLALGVFNVYGFRGEMSRRVRADVAFAGMLIVVQFCIDLMAWFLGMKLVFVNGFGAGVGYPLAVVFAVLFAATIAIFERSVLTADLGLRGAFRSPALLFRVVFVVLASMVTAVPLELFLFNDEIRNVIEGDRSGQIARAQDVLRGNVDALIAQVDGELEKDLKQLEAQYAPLRKYEPATVTSVSPRLATLEKQIEHVTDQMQQEMEGRRSGSSGKGKRYSSLEDQLTVLNHQLELVTGTHNAELADIRKDAQTRVAAAELAYQQAIGVAKEARGKERLALLQKRDEIESLPVATLSSRAKVGIEVADGFSARTRILGHLAEKEETVRLGIWGLRLVMVIFGLLVLIQKATFSTETKAYFSAMARAAQGDSRLQSMFRGLQRLPELSEKEKAAMGKVVDDE
jgi:uncharacterized membrane protein